MRYAIIAILLLLAACTQAPSQPTSGGENSGSLSSTDNPDVVFSLTGEKFRFWMDEAESPDLKVKQGDIVRIDFESVDALHDWKIDQFNAATDKVGAGKKSSVTFVADQKGTFEYYCSIGTHRQMGMKGNLIVE